MDLERTSEYIIQQRARLLGVLAVVVAIMQLRRRRRHRYRRSPRKYGPLVIRDLERQKRLDELYNGSDTNCISQLRMRKAVFWKLCSDKLEFDSDECQEVAAMAATASQVSSSNIESMKPNKKSFKRAGKSKTLPAATQLDRANKAKSKASSSAVHDNNDMDVVLTNTLVGIQQTLAKPMQAAPPPDPNAPLWDMLKNIALTPDDRIAVGMHLCKPEFQVHRGFLINMGQAYLERWVYKYLSGNDPASNL